MAVTVDGTVINSEIASTLNKRVSKEAQDNIFGKMAFMWRLMKLERAVPGGRSIEEPVLYDKGHSKSFGDYETLPARPMDPVAFAKYTRVNYESEIVLNKFRIEENEPQDVQQLDYLNTNVRVAELTLKDNFHRDLVAQETAGSLDITSLHQLLDPAGVIGGIDPATYTWWATQEVADQSAFHAGDVGYDAIEELYDDCSDRMGPPTDAVTHRSVFRAYMKRFRNQQRFNDQEMLKAGFRNILHEGTVPVYYEPDMATIEGGKLPFYFFNAEFIKLWFSPKWNFQRTPDQTPSRQPQNWLSYIIWRGALGMNCRDCHGRVLFTSVSG